MAEYIDRNGLIEALNKFAPEHYSALINQLITKYPTADVVEVVRCEKCKHWNCVSRVTEHMGCDIFCGAYGREYPTLPEDFCSYGERRTDNAG